MAGFYDAPWNTYISTFMPIYTVPADMKKYRVTWVDGDGKAVDSNMNALGGGQPLQLWLNEGVPIPVDAKVSSGSDQEMGIWQPSTDTYWEFWQLKPVKDSSGQVMSYTCRYAGRIVNASQSKGVFLHNQGAGATSIAYADLEIRPQDWASGSINHALAIQLPVTHDSHMSPATRHDSYAAVPSKNSQDAIPEGVRFRLPASFDPAAHAPGDDDRSRFLRMILTAVRDYGAYVVDTTGGTVNLVAEPSTAYGPQASQVPAFWDTQGVFWGAGNVGQLIPWDQMQALAP